jgi:hypothetical protein
VFIRTATLALLASAVTFASPPSHAQTTDDATRAAARQLGYDGIADFQGGKYDAAADKLDRAYRALRAPSLGLWSARAFVKTGKLVSASERYMEVLRLDPGAGDVAVQRQAQADAEVDHAALAPRIPSVVVMVEGAPAEKVAVTVNGVALPSSLVGVKRPVDPGAVNVDGAHAGATASETVNLAEGETKSVTLRFAPVATQAPPARPSAAPPPTGSKPADHVGPSASSQRSIGFIVLGAGGIGILTGATAGGLAISTRSSAQGCQGTNCPTSEKDTVDSYNRLRMISSVGLIAGAALAATGAVLIFTAPSQASTETAASPATYRLAPWLGVDSAGLAFQVER